MGQDKIGRYPLHFHLAGNMPPNTYLRYNSIRKTNFRCVTIHASHNIVVDSNVAFDALGHCFYLEDGVEMNNTFSNNLAVWVQPKVAGERIGSDGTDGKRLFFLSMKNYPPNFLSTNKFFLINSLKILFNVNLFNFFPSIFSDIFL